MINCFASFIRFHRHALLFQNSNNKRNLSKPQKRLAELFYQQTIFFIAIDIKQHYRKSEAVFWKSWCGVSKYTSTTTLLNKLMFHDIHGLKDCPPKHRRIIAKFYANGLHNNFCCMEGCYQWEENLCVCRFCERTLINRPYSLL